MLRNIGKLISKDGVREARRMSQNSYGFIGGRRDFQDRMYCYENEMRTYDLSAKAIIAFAKAVRDGQLYLLELEFSQLTNKQKQGLLNLKLDYSILCDGYFSLRSPIGYPIDIAKKFGHKDIIEHLTSQKNIIDSTEELTTTQGYKK